jgi:uncharacterized membrane protein YvbJ
VFCPNCGTRNDDDSIFCQNCGATISSAKSTVAVTQRSKKKIILSIVGLLIVVILSICSYLYFSANMRSRALFPIKENDKWAI